MKIVFFGDSLTEGVPGVGYYSILQKKLPNHNLINKGKGGDTVISLYRRMKRMDIKKHDISFVWIGTNDILSKIRKSYPIMKVLAGQIWAGSNQEFEDYYHKTLNLVQKKTKKIFTIPPIFIGENINNKWNKKINRLSEVIKNVSENYNKVEFVDIRKNIYPKLEPKESDYIMKNPLKVLMDYLRFKNPRKVDEKSKLRGLQFTLDGVHLNSKGAKIVSDAFYKKISEIEKKWILKQL